MSQYDEVVYGPLDVYLATVGTSFPAVDAVPGAGWTKLGTNGSDDIDDSGVTVTHGETFKEHTGLGKTGPLKVVRTGESLKVGFTLNDITLEQYAQALNAPTVTTVAAGTGTIGTKEITLRQGPTVTEFAVLVRGNTSPYGAGWPAQFEVPRAYQSAQPKPLFKKDTPAGLMFEFTALEDNTASTAAERFGKLIVKSAAAL